MSAPDPTFAAKAERDAAEAQLSVTGGTLEKEKLPAHQESEDRLARADDSFASTPVTTLAGAATKTRVLLHDANEHAGGEFDFMAQSLETLSAFLDSLECGGVPSSLVPDPAVDAATAYFAAVARYEKTTGLSFEDEQKSTEHEEASDQ